MLKFMFSLDRQFGGQPFVLCPTLVTNDHHQNEGKWFRDKKPIDSVGKEANDASRFSGGDFYITFRPFSCRLSMYQKVEHR